ncbi:MAG TPA: aconitate hydratase AcnA [Gammaproteobacteria bacterium]|jgi:aconitate hydratase|nr:aconitate hydratase AcnA [Gammaproteobacteria bacterium]
MQDSFKSRAKLNVGAKSYEIFKLDALEAKYKVSRLPYSLKILLENMLRLEDGVSVTKHDIETLASCDPKKLPPKEIAFTPARVILQDFTGVPAVVDLAAMRDAMKTLGGDPKKINPLCPAELVIDHSVMVDFYGNKEAFGLNAKLEFDRNKERYAFLRWGQNALRNFKVVPPDTGIVHQVNLEFLARVVFVNDKGQAYPDTVVGTDSHTTMINGVGVLGWGVGGIEAEAAMLGQPSTMLIPEVIGVRLTGKLAEGATATDLVLTVTEMLRKRGVVEKFVEFFGDGLKYLPLADRATIANMAPEYGATCGIFPIDDETLTYLRLTGRGEDEIALVEAYAKAQGMWRHDGHEAVYTDVLELDLGSIQPSLAGPKRPQDRVLLGDMQKNFKNALEKEQATRKSAGPTDVTQDGKAFKLADGAVVIAAITSCTNTSNPAVLVAAGLLARKAREKGLKAKPWVKTSLAPGSKVVTEYLKKSNLQADLEAIGFFLAGYGCTTCIGNSGPLPDAISKAVNDSNLSVSAVLSGNRNFEGRVHQEVRMNYLASPPLVVAYALAGSTDMDLTHEPLGTGSDGKPVYLKDIWPTQKEIQSTLAGCLDASMFTKSYGDVFNGDERWQSMKVGTGDIYQWEGSSTYVQNPPYFEGMGKHAPGIPTIKDARCLALFGDSITTDHISPAGAIKKDSPAGKYLMEHGVQPVDFNSYGSRRGNHEVMMRGTFANTRIKNAMVPGVEGGVTKHLPDGAQMPIYDAAMLYKKDNMPLVVIAGKEYGTGSSRDWAAKGTILLGVKAVIAESFERIHRSNLVGMGVLPLTFAAGDSAGKLGLDGSEVFEIDGLKDGAKEVTVKARKADGKDLHFKAKVRIDTPKEWEYYKNGGILHFVLRQLAA